MTGKESASRRDFLKRSALLGASTAALGLMSARPPAVHAAESNTLRIGLVGCGGRGRSAVVNALTVDPNIRLSAVGDAFPDQARLAVGLFKKSPFADRIDATPETTFDGLECYKQVIDQCDVVLLCEPPHFRPNSLKYAIEKDKHVFCEKPVAVDAPGIRSVLASSKAAAEKKLNLVSGLCWRYDLNVRDMMKRVHEGAIGDVLTVRENYLTGRLWTRKREEGDSEIKFQVRNWYYFAWLSGEFNTEQHIHSLDKGLWCFGDEAPAYAYAVGGRMARTDQPTYGDIYDSMGVVYEYEDGRTFFSFCRQQNDTGFNNTDDYFTGSGGTAVILSGLIRDRKGNVLYQQKKVPSKMYELEHKALFGAIRSGGATYINDGDFMTKSTFLGILGREALYTGKRLKWSEELASEVALVPDGYTWESTPPTLPDEKGRYKVRVAGLGAVYHEVVR